MARPGNSRSAPTTPPTARGSARRDGRLDPVRWHRPGRGTLARLTAVALLLATAAVVSWSPLQSASCGPDVIQVGAAPSGPRSPGTAPSAAGPDGAGSGGAGPGGAGSGEAGPAGAGSTSAGPGGAVPAGRMGVPVRLADPTALTLLRPGQRVDLHRLDGGAAVATDALVLTITDPDDLTGGGLLLALSPAEATRALKQPGEGFAVLLRPG